MCGMTLLRVMMLQHWSMATHQQRAMMLLVANHRFPREGDSVSIPSYVTFCPIRDAELEGLDILEKAYRYEGSFEGVGAHSTDLQCVGKVQRVRSVGVHGELSGRNACQK